MAEGDNPARFTNTGTLDETLGPDVVKGSPVTKNRLPEDLARVYYYAGTANSGNDHAEMAQTQKDELPEHKARRDRYPLIIAR